MSHWHADDSCTITLLHAMEPFNNVPHTLIEQDADPMLLSFKRQLLGLPFDGEILETNPRYTH